SAELLGSYYSRVEDGWTEVIGTAKKRSQIFYSATTPPSSTNQCPIYIKPRLTNYAI
ncbi:hypothetical protein HDU76_005187, partial [Blyttiomyces sp. JEL0837]